MIEGSCHCGKVRIAVETAPDEVTSCNCSVCRRGGTLWAYYSPKAVRIDEAVPTHTYIWGDRMLTLHRCADCGCVSHWSPVDPTYDRMGINVRLLEPAILAAARIKHVDGASSGGYTH
jgi:hypothetical protein